MMKQLYSKQAVKSLIVTKIEEIEAGYPLFEFDFSEFFYTSQNILFEVALTLLQLNTIKVSPEDALRYQNNLAGTYAIILPRELSHYVSEDRLENKNTFFKAEDIQTIKGWKQSKFLKLHLLFLVYHYIEDLNKKENQYDSIKMDFLAQEIAGTVNAYIILSHCCKIDFSNKEKSMEEIQALVLAIFEHTHSTAMDCGEELIIPCGVDKAHALYLALKKINRSTYELRVDNAGLGSDAQEFSQGSELLPRFRGEAQQIQKTVRMAIQWQHDFSYEQFKETITDYLIHIYTIFNETLDNTDPKYMLNVTKQISRLQKPVDLLRDMERKKIKQNEFVNNYPAYPKQPSSNCVSYGFFIGVRMRLHTVMDCTEAKMYHAQLLSDERTFSYKRVIYKYSVDQPIDGFLIYQRIPHDTVAYPNELRRLKSNSLVSSFLPPKLKAIRQIVVRELRRGACKNNSFLEIKNLVAGNDEYTDEEGGHLGRKKLLGNLHQSYFEQQNPARIITRLLCGTVGMGKASLAALYANKYGKDYDIIWHFTVDKTIESQFELFAQQVFEISQEDCKNIDVVGSVYASLKMQNKWLLVFINAENIENVRCYLPTAHIKKPLQQDQTAHCLITSIHSEWDEITTKFHVREFTNEEVELFYNKVFSKLKYDRSDYNQLISSLGRHPFALMYIYRYLEKLSAMSVQALISKIKQPNEMQNIFLTQGQWVLTREAEYSISYSLLLPINSFVLSVKNYSQHPLNICLTEFVVKGLAYLPLINIPICLISEMVKVFMRQHALLEEINKLAINVSSALINWSIVDKISGDILKLPPLMRLACQVHRYSENNEYLEKTLAFLLEAFNNLFSYDYAKPPEIKSTTLIYIAQITALSEETEFKNEDENEVALKLYIKFGNYFYYEKRDYERAKVYYLKAKSLIQFNVKSSKEEKCDVYYHLAHMGCSYEFKDPNVFKTALEYANEILSMCGDSLENSELSSNYSCLSLEIHALVAESIYFDHIAENCYHVCLRYLKTNNALQQVNYNYVRASIESSRGGLLYKRKKYYEAIKHLKKALSYRKKLYTHRPNQDIFVLHCNIGDAYLKAEDPDPNSARSEFISALNIAGQFYGEESINHIIVYHFLEKSERQLGNTEAADKILAKINNFITQRPSWINEKDISGRTFLEIATCVGNLAAVLLLVMEFLQDEKLCHKILLLAARHGHLEIIEWFVKERGIAILAPTKKKNNIIFEASGFGQLQVVQWLVSQPSVKRELTYDYKGIALLDAARHGGQKMVEYLVEELDFPTEYCDEYGNTPLLVAGECRQFETVQWLIENNKASINEANKHGKTIMTIIEEIQNSEMLTWLKGREEFFKHNTQLQK